MLFSQRLALLALLVFSNTLLANNIIEKDTMNKDTVLINFASEQQDYPWTVINDGVMGGLSVGKTMQINKAITFSGSVSTANNGGFTSAYIKLPKLPADIRSVRINIKGDGNQYQLRLRSQYQGYDIAYKIEFLTSNNKRETLDFNLADFQATFRGRFIANAPELTPSSISHVGYLITAKQPQEFELATYTIEFH